MDLEELMRALQSTQQQKSSVKLSERNVVELVNKLKQLGYLGDDLLYTINGKEYITTDRLRADIQDALKQSGGRLELVELPALVGVDLVHCERQAALIVEGSGGSIIEAQGELLTNQYFDSLAAEINDLLQDAGVVSLADLAISYALNTELVLKVLSTRVGSSIQGKIDGGLLYTPAYVRNIKAQLRGALRGCTSPLSTPALVKELGLEGVGGGGGGMVSQLVEELVAEGAIKGTLKSGGVNWVPAVFTAAQQEAVSAFYQQNGWVGYDTVRKAGISNEKAYLKAAFPEGMALDTVFVSPGLLANLDASVEETLTGGSWLDASTLLPPALSTGDVGQLLATCQVLGPGGKKKGGEGKKAEVLAATCVVSRQLLDLTQERLVAEARAAADLAIQDRKAAHAGASSSGGGGGGGGGGATPGGKKKVTVTEAAGGDDSDEDWSMGGKKGKKGGKAGGKSKGGKGGSGGGGGNTKGGGKGGKGSGNGSSGEENGFGALSSSALQDKVLELHPDMEDAGPSGGLVKAIVELLRPAAMSAYQEALAAAFTATAEQKRRAKEAAAKALEAAAVRLQLYSKGAELLQDQPDTQSLVVKHMLRTGGSEALDALLAWCQQEFCPDMAAAAAGAAGSSSGGAGSTAAAAGENVVWFATPAVRQKVMAALPQEIGGPVGKAVEASNGVDIQEFIVQLETAAGKCGLRLKKLDKKSEKAALAAQKARLLQLLAPEATPATALALAVPLLVLQYKQKLLSIPGRGISTVLQQLSGQLSPAAFEFVSGYHEAVVDSLKLQSGAGGEGEQQEGKLVQLQQQLEEKLTVLKALVGLGELPPELKGSAGSGGEAAAVAEVADAESAAE